MTIRDRRNGKIYERVNWFGFGGNWLRGLVPGGFLHWYITDVEILSD